MISSPDTARLDDAPDRANEFRRRAFKCRRVAETALRPAAWLSAATQYDAEADEIMRSMKDEGHG